ncbi:hypothetical protein PINS_up000710 [Pythium insidiosum]|nr:hypothetical protein PINS_up000710 [Pythium insidiosum]
MSPQDDGTAIDDSSVSTTPSENVAVSTVDSRRMVRSILVRELPQVLGSLPIHTLNAVFKECAGSTAFFTSVICEQHQVPHHPESHRRTQVIRESILRDVPMVHVVTDIAPATREQLLSFHTVDHVDGILSRCDAVEKRAKQIEGSGNVASIAIDDDTTVMEGTRAAALIAAGAVCQAVDLVMDDSNDIRNAFCGVRPPGHHAEPNKAMGFCFFNNIGVGACHLLDRYRDRIQRILILDFDVHHGNGTQAKFENQHPQIGFVSTHQGPFYPGTGRASERGSHGNVLNLPLVSGTTSAVYRTVFTESVMPFMDAFQPDFILVSAGFDAHRADPLAGISLDTEDYYWITKHVTDIAWKHAQGRIVSVLEGGYNLNALAASACSHVRALVEGATPPTKSATADVDALTKAFAATASIGTSKRPLRVTVHVDAKTKLVVLETRSVKELVKQCKNKFQLKKSAATIKVYDRHGALVTDVLLSSMSTDGDSHLYVR